MCRDLSINLTTAPTLFCNNLGDMYLSFNPVFYSKTKHVEIDFHFVRDRVLNKSLRVAFYIWEGSSRRYFKKAFVWCEVSTPLFKPALIFIAA